MHPFCLETLVRQYVSARYHVEMWQLYDMTRSYTVRILNSLDLNQWYWDNFDMVQDTIKQVVFHGGVR